MLLRLKLMPRFALFALALLLPAGAWAAPITYGFDNGSITYRVTAGTQELAVATVAMTGSFATFDAPNTTLDDFPFDGGLSGPIVLSPSDANVASFILENTGTGWRVGLGLVGLAVAGRRRA
jgi:hypothetical protein